MSAPTKRFGGWVAYLGLGGWAAGAALLWLAAGQRGWSPGELVLAAAVWLAVLAVAAREPVRNLFGPVFWYEVTRVGRRFSTFLFRFVYVAMVGLLLGMMYWSWRDSVRWNSPTGLVSPYKLSEFAASFFNTFMVVQYGVLLVVTPAYVAGAITDEKERKTIDYLFTTDLANREIVFGKLAARVANVFLYVLAGLPVLAFMQLFGGIDPDLVLAGTAAALVTAVGLSAVGIAFSAASKRSRDAIVVSYGMLVLYLFLSLAVGFMMKGFSSRGWTVMDFGGGWKFDWADGTDWLAAGNAAYVVPLGTDWGRDFDPGMVVRMLGRYAAFWGVVSVLAIGWAVTRLRRVALRQQYGVARSKKSLEQVARSRPEMGDRPLVWREVFAADRRVGCFGVFFRIAIVLLVAAVPLIGLWAVFFRDWLSYSAYDEPFAEKWKDYAEGMSGWLRVCTGVLAFLVMFAAALRGAGAVAGEKDRDTWVSLCTTPVSVTEFLSAKWLGAVLNARFALWVLLGVWAVGLALGSVWWFMLPVAALYLFVFTSAFALAGIWCSIGPKTALGANARAFFLAVFLAGGFWLPLIVCCGFPLSLMDVRGEAFSNLAVLPLGATPPVAVGFLPVGSFEKYDSMGLGPFHPEQVASGPCALVFGLIVWGCINLLLFVRVKHRLTQEMNRGRIAPDEPGYVPARRRPAAE